MINVIATIEVNAGKAEEFLALFKANVPAVLAEEGCIEYYPTRHATTSIEAQDANPNKIVIIEKWESVTHLDAHLVAPHMVTFAEQVQDLVSNVTLNILEQA